MNAHYRRAQTVLTMMSEEKDEDDIWQGFLTHKLAELGIGINFYGKITWVLQELGKVEKLRRGHANTPSVWRIIDDTITENEFELLRDKLKSNPNRRRLELRILQLETEVKDIKRMLRSKGLDKV